MGTNGTYHGTRVRVPCMVRYCNTYHGTFTCTYHGTYVRTRVRTYNVMSQLSDWKRAHMRTENHVCFGRIHVRTRVRTYMCTYVRTCGRTSGTMYHGTSDWYHGTSTNGTCVRTMVHGTYESTYHGTYTCTTNGTRVRTRVRTMVLRMVRTLTCMYVRTYNVTSQLSDWKRAHMCTENHVCFGRIHGSQLREGANAGQHTPTLSLPPSQYGVPWYVHVYVRTYVRTMVLEYHGTYSVPLVRTYYGHTYVRTTYACTNVPIGKI
jgi:hypothetical protein